MSSICHLDFIEGYLVCTVQHRDYRNCDLYQEDGNLATNYEFDGADL